MSSHLSHKEHFWKEMDEFCTRHLMVALRLKVSTADLIKQHALRCGRRVPIIADLREVISNFPVFFAVAYRKELQSEGSLGKLFPASKYAKLHTVTDYWEMREELAVDRGGRPLAMLIKWPRLTEPMVLHTCAYPRQAPGLRIVYNVKDAVLTLEPLSQFLKTCLADFVPSADEHDVGADEITDELPEEYEEEVLPQTKKKSLPNLDNLADEDVDFDDDSDMELDLEIDD